jgi:beta propeller repeat protein
METRRLTRPFVIVALTAAVSLPVMAQNMQEFAVYSSSKSQQNPDISGNTVVWQDDRSGTWNIYGVELSGPEFAPCTAGIEGDVNGDCKMDCDDFAALASHWLDCNPDLSGACWQ